MSYDNYRLLAFSRDGAVVTATVDAPPVNVITMELLGELQRMTTEVEADPDCLVFVFKSANPDFFLAHFDVSAILEFPTDKPPARGNVARHPFYAMANRLRSMDKATIAQIEGRVGGGGSEFAMGFDMRFGVIGKATLNQMETPLGILPGGGGTQLLPRLIGRSRALEVILGGVDISAEEAAAWGYLNRALPADEIGSYVAFLAKRIASFPPEAVRLAKQAVNGSIGPLDEGLQEENFLFQRLFRTPDARRKMEAFLSNGGQTREGELRVAELSARLAEMG
ncbi:MAG: enoyl-CoA hydratase/isomerase family protein [Hyphomicrobiales bacterium]|nr:enoyl-CoA hydratase/isomerase family protein [Hyphomicrobiales bacterium]